MSTAARRVLALAGMSLLALVALPTANAAAHAQFVAGTPRPGATLRTPPASVRIVFSEPLDAAMSGIDVYFSSGRRVIVRSAGVDPTDPRSYRVGLPHVKPDRYAVMWHTVSAIDGHSRRGSYTFTVDRPDGSAPRIAHHVPLTEHAPPQVPITGQAASLWFALSGLFVLIGAVLMGRLARDTGLLGIHAVRRLLGWSVVVGTSALVAGTASQLMSVWAQAGWGAASLGALLSSPVGRWWAARVVAAVAILAWWRWAPARRWSRVLQLAAAALAAYSFAATSHGAAAHSPAGVCFAFAHVLAVSLWVGGAVGVAALWVIARRVGSGAWRMLVHRYSVLAGVAVPIVIASGLGNAVLEVGRFGDLASSSYGRSLLIKLGVVVALLAVAAVNATLLRPALDAGRAAARHLNRTLAIEAGLGLAVLVPTAVLAVLAPSGSSGAAHAAGTQARGEPASAWLGLIALTGGAAALLAATRGVRIRRLRAGMRALGAGATAVALALAGTLAIGATGQPIRATGWGRVRSVPPVMAAGARIWRLPPSSGPMMPAVAPDGSVWVAEMNVNKLVRLDPRADVIQEFRFSGEYRETMGIAIAADGRVWLAQQHAMALGMFDPVDGRYHEFPIPGGVSAPVGIAIGPDGAVWFTEMSGDRIGRFDPRTARFRQYRIPTNDAAPYWLTVGPDGRVWFTEFAGGKVGLLDPDTGSVREYAIPGHPNLPALAVTRDGTVWVTSIQGALYRLSPLTGAIRAIPLPVAGDYGLAVGPDGELWVGCDGGRAVFVVQPDTGRARRHLLPVGSAPWWPAVDPTGHVWVVLAGAGTSGLAELTG